MHNVMRIRGQAAAENGFSLVEVMVSMGISTILMLGFATYLNYQGQSIKGMQGMSSRDAIVVNLRTLAGMGTALRSTADYTDGGGGLINPELNAMIYPGDQNPPGADCDNNWHDLALYSPQRVSWGDPLGAPNGDLIAGKWDSETTTSLLHKRYQLEGAPCPDGTAANDLCPIDAYTRFRAVRCANAEQAELIEVSFKVRQNPDVNLQRASLRLRDEEGSAFLEVGAILDDNIVQCPNPDQVMMGWDMKGDAICVTMTAAEGTAPSCGPRQVFRGYSSINADPDGDPSTNDAVMVPICEDITCAVDETFGGFDTTGAQICHKRHPCPTGQVLTGFQTLTIPGGGIPPGGKGGGKGLPGGGGGGFSMVTGTPICEPLPEPSVACSPQEVLTFADTDNNGSGDSYQCKKVTCEQDETLVGFNEDGSVRCADGVTIRKQTAGGHYGGVTAAEQGWYSGVAMFGMSQGIIQVQLTNQGTWLCITRFEGVTSTEDPVITGGIGSICDDSDYGKTGRRETEIQAKSGSRITKVRAALMMVNDDATGNCFKSSGSKRTSRTYDFLRPGEVSTEAVMGQLIIFNNHLCAEADSNNVIVLYWYKLDEKP